MKKVLILLACLILMCACEGEHSAKITSDNETLYEVEKIKYTKYDLFNALINGDIQTPIDSAFVIRLAEAEGIDPSQFDLDAEEYYNYIAWYGQAYLDYFGSKENIFNIYKANACAVELTKNFIDTKYDMYFESYKPVKLQLAHFESEEVANKFIAEVNAGTSFADAALNNGYTTTIVDKTILNNDQDQPTQILDFLKTVPSVGLSSPIEATVTMNDAEGNSVDTPRFYVLNILTTDKTEIHDDFLATLMENGEVDTDEGVNYAISKHEIKFYDQNTYDAIKKLYEVEQ